MSLRRWASVGLVFLMSAMPMSPVVAQANVDAEAVMAAFVYRFTQFVEWPEASLQDRERFDICVAASDDWLDAIQTLVAGAEIGGRPFQARIADPGALDGCQVVFVSGETEGVEDFVAGTDGEPILTVSDAPGFLDAGGMIELRIVDRRVRFGVNVGSAAGAGLRMSSQLLDLALEVRGAPS